MSIARDAHKIDPIALLWLKGCFNVSNQNGWDSSRDLAHYRAHAGKARAANLIPRGCDPSCPFRWQGQWRLWERDWTGARYLGRKLCKRSISDCRELGILLPWMLMIWFVASRLNYSLELFSTRAVLNITVRHCTAGLHLVQTAHVSSLPLTYGRQGKEPQLPCTRYSSAPFWSALLPGTYSASLSTHMKSRELSWP